MIKVMKKSYYRMGAAMTLGMVAMSGDAHAANTFSNIAKNIQLSISSLPGLLTGLAYLFGILLGVLGVLKIKDHVENPSQTPLKDGAIRLAAGGALFGLPILFEAMFQTIDAGATGASATTANLEKVKFAVS